MYDELVKRLRGHANLVREYNESGKLFDDAADAIEELSRDLDSMNEANIALYGALPRWIPVTERLPREMETVLVTDGKNVGFSFCVNDYGTMDFYSPWNVTHWMPLPSTEGLNGT